MLIGIPSSITPEFIYALAKMGHGDLIVIADSNFPSDSVASNCVVKSPIRVHGKTSDILKDILKLIPFDRYSSTPVSVMDRVESDKVANLKVETYEEVENMLNSFNEGAKLDYIERMEFYEVAKKAFVVIQPMTLHHMRV